MAMKVKKSKSVLSGINLVGVSGFARSGKDTAYEAIKEIFNEESIERVAFADALKLECLDFLRKNTGLSTFTTIDEEKEMIRPFLVAYGTNIRRKLDPDCWIKSIEEKISNEQDVDLFVVTDTRYTNESDWIKSRGGILIHINRDGIGPANNEEATQGPRLAEAADIKIDMPTFKEGYKEKCKQIIKKQLESH